MIKIVKLLIYTLVLVFGVSTIKAQNIEESKEIKSLIAKKREYNKYNGTGFRIQLYNGSEKRARNIKFSFEKQFSGTYSKLKYEAPDWKVQVGRYRTRLDADRALNKIREKFSGAIVIPL